MQASNSEKISVATIIWQRFCNQNKNKELMQLDIKKSINLFFKRQKSCTFLKWQMANKHRKIGATSLTMIREMEINITMIYYSHPSEWLKLKRQKIPSINRYGATGTPMHCWCEIMWIRFVHFGKMTVSYKVKHTSNYDPGILLLGKA